MATLTNPPRSEAAAAGSDSSPSPTSVSSSIPSSIEYSKQPSSPPAVTLIELDAFPQERYKSTKYKEDYAHLLRRCRLGNKIRWLLGVLCCAILLSFAQPTKRIAGLGAPKNVRLWEILHPQSKSSSDPEGWIHKNSVFDYDSLVKSPGYRPKAALISLVRNEELGGILQSMRQLEYYFNRRHNYPWIFFSEVAFSDEFKTATSNATSAPTEYHLIPVEHWSTPANISWPAFYDSLDYLGALGVGKGSLLSYRHMCRWNSLFFFHHPALIAYTHYWRIEPDVHFFCHIPYDPLSFLASNNLIYGFNMAILEDARSFPSLWRTTLTFISQHPELLHPDADLSWLIDRTQGNTYNNCQFFSNFEIGDLRFFRSAPVQAYLRHLDESGGFFYERFGDAPIHTLAVSLFAARDQVWFFRDIGYQHDSTRHCPADWLRGGGGGGSGVSSHGARKALEESGGESCACEPTGLDQNFYSLVPMESPQRKPRDTCIRSWLGGEWLRKKDGWRRDVEVALGGDGYGGYARG